MLTAKAIGEIFECFENLKKNIRAGKEGYTGMSGSKGQLSVKTSLKKELDDLKSQIKNMRDSMGQSHDFSKFVDKGQKRYPNESYYSAKGKPIMMSEGLTSEFVKLKKKVYKMELTLDSVESGYTRLTNDHKHKFQMMSDNIQGELDTLKLLKDRISLVKQCINLIRKWKC